MLIPELAKTLEPTCLSSVLTDDAAFAVHNEDEVVSDRLEDLKLFSGAKSTAEIREHAARILLLSQRIALTKKRLTPQGVTEELKALALVKHDKNEEFNSRTNLRFRTGRHNRFARQVLIRAQHFMYEWLGLLDHHYDDVMSGMSLGSGSVYSKAERSLFSKLSSEQTISANALTLLDAILTNSPALFEAWANAGVKLRVVAGNKLAYVPKDVKNCRLIAVEPSLNVMIQLGIGKVLTRICRRIGQDITDQERNRQLAREGSITGAFATIDLSDASSLISIELVRFLVPSDWYLLLDAARCKQYTANNGKTFRTWESFSSQGNAFTFPLETLIFTAITRASHEIYCEYRGLSAGRKNISVYGDDIICPTPSARAVMNGLHACGLRVNTSKSYYNDVSPCFRESCGFDAYGGHNVRPIYYKMDALKPSDVAKLHNGLLTRYNYFRVSDTIEWLRGLCPSRLKGPYGVIRSDESMERNTTFIPSDHWFIEPDSLAVSWGARRSTTTVKWRYYAVSQKKYAEKLTAIHPDLLLQIVMFGGKSWDDSPLSRPSTKTATAGIEAIVASEEVLHWGDKQ